MALPMATTSEKQRVREGQAAMLIALALPLARAANVMLTWEPQLNRQSRLLAADVAALRRHTERFVKEARKAGIL